MRSCIIQSCYPECNRRRATSTAAGDEESVPGSTLVPTVHLQLTFYLFIRILTPCLTLLLTFFNIYLSFSVMFYTVADIHDWRSSRTGVVHHTSHKSHKFWTVGGNPERPD